MATLTKEQKERMEENRRRALEKIAYKEEIERKRMLTLKLQEVESGSKVKVDNNMASSGNRSSGLSGGNISVHSSLHRAPFSSPFHSTQHQSKGGNAKQNYKSYQQNPAFSRLPAPARATVTGECCLLSKDRFLVDVPYQTKVIDIFKSLGSGMYNGKTKKWSFPIADHDKLMTKLHALAGEVSISGVPKKVLNLFAEEDVAEKAASLDLSPVDPELLSHLMPFQEDGVRFGVAKGGRCLIADDMGLGKTIQALGIASYFHCDWPLLIVCPTSVRFDWLEAIRTWLPAVPDHTVAVMTTSRDVDRDAAVLITSYSLLTRALAVLRKCAFGFIILDESHFLKTQTSARTKAVSELVRGSRRVVLLSGTPALSRPVELFPQLAILDPRMFRSLHEFGLRYCAARMSPRGFWDYSGASNMPELDLLLRRCCMLRRLKADVLAQLPAKLRQVILLKPKGLGSCREVQHFEELLRDSRLTGMDRRGKLLQYYNLSGTCKLPVVTEYLSELLECNSKFLVFAHHQAVLDGICKLLVDRRVDFIRIDGSTASATRKELCDRFQYDDRCLVAVLSITAANTGITLTSAQLVIFAELFWNPGVLIQAEDRAHRIGQMDSVTVRYLVAPGTADDHLWPLIQAKLEVLNHAGLSRDNFRGCEAVHGGAANGQTSIQDFFSALSECLEDGNDAALLEAARLLDA